MMQQLLVAYDLLAGRLAAEEEEEEETGSGSSEAAAGKESEPGTATDIINNKLTAAASIAPGRVSKGPRV